jgi:hypothetical protein
VEAFWGSIRYPAIHKTGITTIRRATQSVAGRASKGAAYLIPKLRQMEITISNPTNPQLFSDMAFP